MIFFKLQFINRNFLSGIYKQNLNFRTNLKIADSKTVFPSLTFLERSAKFVDLIFLTKIIQKSRGKRWRNTM